jgi:hypothetical protein
VLIREIRGFRFLKGEPDGAVPDDLW